MKQKKFTEEQIVKVVKEKESGISGRELARRYGVREETIYRWSKKYGGMEVADVKKIKHLEQENNRLKTLVADLMLDNKILKDINSKNW